MFFVFLSFNIRFCFACTDDIVVGCSYELLYAGAGMNFHTNVCVHVCACERVRAQRVYVYRNE